MKIAAVVVTYNRKKLLLRCVRAILNQSRRPDEIIIYDNASTDGTPDALVTEGILDDPTVRYLRGKENLGGAGGFYYGSKAAYRDGADWIWMTDDDGIADRDALKELENAANLNIPAGFFISGAFDEEGHQGLKSTVDTESEWYLAEGILPVRWATFVGFFFSRTVVEKCGLPYKGYFVWGDDAEYGGRLREKVGPGYVVGKSRMCHLSPRGGGCGIL